MLWTKLLHALIRCELTASYDCLGNVRVSAKGMIAVLVVYGTMRWLFS